MRQGWIRPPGSTHSVPNNKKTVVYRGGGKRRSFLSQDFGAKDGNILDRFCAASQQELTGPSASEVETWPTAPAEPGLRRLAQPQKPTPIHHWRHYETEVIWASV